MCVYTNNNFFFIQNLDLINDLCWLNYCCCVPAFQYAADTLPFGGIGESGIGSYHGKFSFDAFSHQKAVARRSFLTDFWFRFPPWDNHKFQLLESAYSFDYLGILLTILGLKRPRNVLI